MRGSLSIRRIHGLAPCLATRIACQNPRQRAFELRGPNRVVSTVAHSESEDIGTFRHQAFVPEVPLVLKGSHTIVSVKQWFIHHDEPSLACLSPYLSQHGSAHFPYELIRYQGSAEKDPACQFENWLRTEDENLALYLPDTNTLEPESSFGEHDVFHRFFAPLDLLSKAVEYNRSQDAENRVKRLYIAQSQLNELPQALQEDLPIPNIVRQAGKGDVYDSSIWLGLEPTYTPLHRDPNPNLFVQILSSKTIRLLTPTLGQQLYAKIQHQLGSRGNSRFRGQEMMQGPERTALYDAIWHSKPSADIHEATLDPGDALFIPKGWWHSVKSRFDDGRLNASVNWWFR
ncbi:putative JmjC domain-containing protein [Seiridium cardinale]